MEEKLIEVFNEAITNFPRNSSLYKNVIKYYYLKDDPNRIYFYFNLALENNAINDQILRIMLRHYFKHEDITGANTIFNLSEEYNCATQETYNLMIELNRMLHYHEDMLNYFYRAEKFGYRDKVTYTFIINELNIRGYDLSFIEKIFKMTFNQGNMIV